MSSPLDSLRISFEKMNISQKHAFINKLKMQAQSKNNPEFTKFLNECVRKYDAEVDRNKKIIVKEYYNNNQELGDDSLKIHTPSLTLSIIGLAFCWVGSLALFGIPCSIIALIMSIKNKDTYNTKASFIMGIVGCSIGALVVLVWVVIVPIGILSGLSNL